MVCLDVTAHIQIFSQNPDCEQNRKILRLQNEHGGQEEIVVIVLGMFLVCFTGHVV